MKNRAEDALKELADEVERFKLTISDKKAMEMQEMQSYSAQVKDLKYQNEQYYHQVQAKQEEIAQLNQEIMGWRDVVDRLNNESAELKKIIEDLEMKNRKLVDKLNDQIYQKATEYKERTLQALQKSESPTKLRKALGGMPPNAVGSEHRLNQVLQDENRAPEYRESPLK